MSAMTGPTQADGTAAVSSRPTALRFEDVTRRFGDTLAVAPVSLRVAPGEFVSLIGPSGCGKSTLLRLASGLDTPSSGAVHRNVENLGYVFQEPTLMPWRTVRQNIDLLARLDGVPKEARRPKVDEVIELVGLTEFADLLPHQLSGGMKMRTSVARSLVLDPELFLFDEPFGALDQISRTTLNLELMELFARSRFAGLFVTHSVEEAVLLSTRVVVMSAHPGRITTEFAVPFDYPRTPALTFEPAFVQLASAVYEALGEASA